MRYFVLHARVLLLLLVGVLFGFNFSLFWLNLFFGTSTTSNRLLRVENEKQQSPSPDAVACSREELDMLMANPRVMDTNLLALESQCPHNTWLPKMLFLDGENHPNYLSMSVGCNKAVEAIGTARLLSKNPSFDKHAWVETLERVTNSTVVAICSPEGNNVDFTQLDISSGDDALPQSTLDFYCIEPIPQSVHGVKKTIEELHLNELGFRGLHYVISNSTGTVKVPSTQVTGREEYSRIHCQGNDLECHDVPMITLDELAEKHFTPDNQNQTVDMLSIDANGFDFQVLQGAKILLQRTRYVEFEYDERWGRNSLLKDAVNYLDNLGFTCYMEGAGRLYKLTQCWVENYEMGKRSNVACVNRSEAAWLKVMETIFQKTLSGEE